MTMTSRSSRRSRWRPLSSSVLLAGLWAGASTLATGCGASTSTESTPGESPSAAHAPGDVSSPTATGRYAVHEWGLVDITRDGVVELAAGPGQRALAAAPSTPGPIHPGGPGMARKPVLYFHLLEGEVHVSVAASMTYGGMLERFPPAPLAGRQITWDDVQIVGRACGSTPYPSVDSAACQGIPDGYCEAAELAHYEAHDASCIVVDGQDYNHLFYRGGGRGLSLPVSVSSTARSATLANQSGYDIPVAWMVEGATPSAGARRDRAAELAPRVTIRRFGRVPAGTSAEVREAIPVQAAIDATRTELATLGLSAGEIQAFMNAWEQAVFRAPNVPRSVIYLLPAELVDAVSTLQLSPAPAETRRAMMVRVEL